MVLFIKQWCTFILFDKIKYEIVGVYTDFNLK
jgi:hypothetical protein